jgi:tetratricopeptide (TPR) repeat protein
MRLPTSAAALLELAAREEAQAHLAPGPARPLLQAQLLLLQGDPAGALQLLEQVLGDACHGPLAHQAGGGSMALDALATAGDCHMAAGSPAQARQLYCRAFKAAHAAHLAGGQQLVLLGAGATGGTAGGGSLQAQLDARQPDDRPPAGDGPQEGDKAGSAARGATRLVWDSAQLLRVALALGGLYSSSGDRPSALATLLAAAEVQPCASVWLAAGVTCLESGDLEGADLALVAANGCDSGHPKVWGQLALLAARGGRMQEAKQVGGVCAAAFDACRGREAAARAGASCSAYIVLCQWMGLQGMR